MTARRRLLLVPGSLLAVGAVLLAITLRDGTVVAGGANLLVTGRGGEAIINENNSPSVAVNPTRPANVVVVNRIDRPRYSAVIHWTVDGGHLWNDTALPLPAGRDRPYAPDAAFGPDGVLYVSYVNLEGSGNDPQTLWVARSNDGGRTLAAPVPVAGRYSFQGRVAAGERGRVYLTWLQGTTVGLLSLNPPAPVMMAVSADGGTTFSSAVQVSDPGRVRVGAASPVVDSEGNVDVLYEDFKGDARDFLNLDGPPWDGPFALVLARSTDQGRTFGSGVEVDTGVVTNERFLVYLPRSPSIAAGPDRSLYVAWADGRQGTDQVMVRRSADDGATWGPAAPVSAPTSGPGVSAWLPRVAVAPNGRVDVLYLAGHRFSGDGLVDAYLAVSLDQARTFRAIRVSSRSFDSRIGPLTGPGYLPPDLGSQLGLRSGDSGGWAAWVDTRQGTADSGRQDIFVAASAVTGGDVSAARAAAASVMIVLAMAVLAGGLADVWMIRRRGGSS